MTLFGNILKKIEAFERSPSPSPHPLHFFGVSGHQWVFLLYEFLKHSPSSSLGQRSHIFISPTLEEAESLYQQLKSLPGWETLFFPGLEISPYYGVISSEKNLLRRFRVLDQLLFSSPERPLIVVTTLEAFLMKLPPPEFFRDNAFTISVTDVCAPEEMAAKLVSLGYLPAPAVEEPGTFCRKGELFDIFPVNGPPVRLHYFDEMVEEIFPIEWETQKTLRSSPLEKVRLSPAPPFLAQGIFAKTLKSKIPMPASQYKNRYEERKKVFSQLSEGQLFENYPVFLPLFFEKNALLLDYLPPARFLFSLVDGDSFQDKTEEYREKWERDFAEEQEKMEGDCLLPPPQELYHLLWEGLLEKAGAQAMTFNRLKIGSHHQNHLDLNFETIPSYFQRNVSKGPDKFQFIKNVLVFLKEEFADYGHLIISCHGKSSQEEISYLFQNNQIEGKILERVRFIPFPLEEGLYYPEEKILVLSDGDLFSHKKAKAKKATSRKVDLFAEQLSTLKNGDFVIHNNFGIGEYQGLETLVIGGQSTDFLVLHYEDKDKVYVPVYKMNLIQKFAEAGTHVKVNSLKSNKFNELKARAKKSAKILAFDLMKLAAQRQSHESFAFSPPDHLFKEFEMSFPFEETLDQENAINDVLGDMQKPYPMDRLVCGDVGFGKTEVAMRAAYKAVLDKKQVAVLVPTTILALQHYNSFSERFKDIPVNIEFLSRFKSAGQSKKIVSDLKEGKIDIIIGTHKLLAKEIAFADLGLVIIDEEQRFGVAHKEKLKLMKSTVGFLTLTATPIPRTMQMTYLGIRDLSLIQTPPPKRQSIKTYIIKEEPRTIKMAIQNELDRGGQVFYVHNRVQNIESVAAKIREMVPAAKITIAHGQLQEKELEKRISAFYQKQTNVLVSTTIIESGLDIPSANTMIVNRADTFGLAQLHQLRGRIGRSDKKAFAYFVVSKEKNLTEVADKRLKALQTYADLGSGFAIASCDLEIRGAGDILGGEQSGHIESIGLELYTELLNEAISELKGEDVIPPIDIEVQLSEPSFIPHQYMTDPGVRLKYYKKLSNCKTLPLLSELKTEINDIFGPLPEEVNNLLIVLEIRILLQKSGLKLIKVIGDKIHMKFDKTIIDNSPKLQKQVVETFLAHPKKYKVGPDYSVVYIPKIPPTKKDLLNFSKQIAEQIIPC